MKPQKVTVENEREERQRALCDQIVYRAARMMLGEVKAPMPMVLDRLLTFAAAQAVAVDGEVKTALAFRVLADRIEAGLFRQEDNTP